MQHQMQQCLFTDPVSIKMGMSAKPMASMSSASKGMTKIAPVMSMGPSLSKSSKA